MGRKMTQSLRQSDFEHWSEYEDFKGSAKSVGSYRIEFLGGTDRGAIILVWMPMSWWRKWDFSWDPKVKSDDGESFLQDQINFMHYGSAAEEYLYLTHVSDVNDIMRRNM